MGASRFGRAIEVCEASQTQPTKVGALPAFWHWGSRCLEVGAWHFGGFAL